MWIFSASSGFFSVVEDEDDPDRLVVRARVGGDLDGLRRYVPDLSATAATPERDYPYRATCSRSALATAVARMVLEIDYPNYKAAVATRHGWARERIYARIWAVMRGAEAELATSEDLVEAAPVTPRADRPTRGRRPRRKRAR